MVKKVLCPVCGQTVLWAKESIYKPFCSERCKQIDLGAWASETYTIPVSEENNIEIKVDGAQGKAATE